jgi:hypothetical protein
MSLRKDVAIEIIDGRQNYRRVGDTARNKKSWQSAPSYVSSQIGSGVLSIRAPGSSGSDISLCGMALQGRCLEVSLGPAGMR